MLYVSVVKVEDKFWMAWKGKAIVGFESEKAGLAYYEDAYKAAHARSHEGSMSACVNFIFLQPSIVGFKNEEAIKKVLKMDKDGGVCPAHLSNGLVRMDGVECNKKAEALWEKGAKPHLIKEGWAEEAEIERAEAVLRKHGRLPVEGSHV